MSAAATSAEIDRGRDLLHSSRGVVVLTGAGLSADSGLATFRGPGGLWRKYRPEELATPEAFRRDPRLVWEWYEARRRAAAEAAPNDAHRAIAEFALRRDDVTIVTQNVDGLHTLAARCVAAEQAAEMRLAANAAGRKAGAGGGCIQQNPPGHRAILETSAAPSH
ncbi:MAG: hypothetical protein IH849_10155 [Acidobacteria bacterium]|nr:hypothetical protein [Acidobacteriota bacterium]